MRSPNRNELLDSLSAKGVTAVRFELDWNIVEPQPGSFRWTFYDAVIEQARRLGLDITLTLGPCATWAVDPEWEVPPDQARYSVPHSLDSWRAYVRAAVTRYGNRVNSWQIREQPNIRQFRGAESEYLRLLDSAAAEIRALSPRARIIRPEGGALAISSFYRFLRSPASESIDVYGLFAPESSQRLLLDWSILTGEILDPDQIDNSPDVWLLGQTDRADLSPERWKGHYLLAWLFGAERVYLPLASLDETWAELSALKEYRGYRAQAPDQWTFLFKGEQGLVAVSYNESQPLRLEAVPASSAEDITAEIGEEKPLSDEALSLEDFTEGRPTRSHVLAARGTIIYTGLPLVYADYSMPKLQEFGLHNRSLRGLRGGAVTEQGRAGRTCAVTHMTYRQGEEELDNPWFYFDIDDSWIYFDCGQSVIAITLECEGAFRGEQMLGFNLLYDSVGGYRFTEWQWVDAGYQWRRYRFIIDDACFSNRDGYDFRINAKGSKQDLWLLSVTVERLESDEEIALARNIPGAAQ